MASDAVTDLITLLSGAFPERKIDEKLINAYISGLDDLTPSSMVAAGKQLIRTSKYFPRVAEIRAAARAAVGDVSGFDNLMADYQEIVDNLYHEPDIYRDMADRFTRAGRLCMAESVRLRADRCDEYAEEIVI